MNRVAGSGPGEISFHYRGIIEARPGKLAGVYRPGLDHVIDGIRRSRDEIKVVVEIAVAAQIWRRYTR